MERSSVKKLGKQRADLQNPVPTDGDSVYCKDIDKERSDISGWTGDVCDFFNDLHSEVYNDSSDNPKTLLVHFQRSTVFPSIAFGNSEGGNFSNIKIYAVTSGGGEVPIFDESSDSTKLTSKIVRFGAPVGMNAVKIEFHTADRVGITNIFIPKMSEIVVNADNESNPIHVNDTDHNKRTALNSVFGDRLVGMRKPTIAAQFQYGLASDDATTTIVGSGAANVANSLLTINTGTDSNGAVTIQSNTYLRYIPGHEAYCYFTGVFSQGVASSHQYAGLFDSNDGFYLGYNETEFVVGRRRQGVDYQQVVDITKVFPLEVFDPTKGNVYAITFGYLGFATINFSVLDSSGVWRNIGRIEYPNTQTITHITQTNLPVRAEAVNAGNTTDLVFSTGSLTAGIVDGAETDPGSRKFNYSLGLQAITSGIDTLVGFRNKSTYSGIENRIPAVLDLISAATDLNKIVGWKILKNAPLVGGETWNDVSADSVLEVSTDLVVSDATGETFLDWTMGRLDTFFEIVKELALTLQPNDTATFIISTPGGTSGDVDLAIRWEELF